MSIIVSNKDTALSNVLQIQSPLIALILYLSEVLELCEVCTIFWVPNIYLPDLMCALHATISQTRC